MALKTKVKPPAIVVSPDGPVLLEVFRAIGTPYTWGGGSLTDRHRWPNGVPTQKSVANGYDCSGFVLHALAASHLIDAENYIANKVADLASGGIMSLGTTIQDSLGQWIPQPGDVFCYDGHVMLYAGRGHLIGASGGTSETHGDSPISACVKIVRYNYRSDIIQIVRLPKVIK